MATGLGLSLRTSQHLALTPQLQQSIKMLQLSSQELALEVSAMLEQNPCLVEDDELELEVVDLDDEITAPQGPLSDGFGDAPIESATGTEDDSDQGPDDWDGDGTVEIDVVDAEWADGPGDRSQVGTDQGDSREASESLELGLIQHLLAQSVGLRLDPMDKAALIFSIHSLDEDGFLKESSGEMLEAFLRQIEHRDARDRGLEGLNLARRVIQQFDPVGLGVSNVVESLHVQAADRFNRASEHDRPLWSLVQALLSCPLLHLARRDLKKLSKVCVCDESQVELALVKLRELNPRPASAFKPAAIGWVVPEVLVRRDGRGLKVEINSAALPKLRFDSAFADLARGGAKAAAFHQSAQDAKWFLKNIRQRFDTILRVSEVIVDRQRRFFSHGPTGMKPLVLREVADELGVHESTVSRVTTSKFMQTPLGTFELKYFFGSSLSTSTGVDTSATAVRAIIAQIVEQENRSEPLSDADISDVLASRGITCARRTVAKYRETLNIPVVSLRLINS